MVVDAIPPDGQAGSQRRAITNGGVMVVSGLTWAARSWWAVLRREAERDVAETSARVFGLAMARCPFRADNRLADPILRMIRRGNVLDRRGLPQDLHVGNLFVFGYNAVSALQRAWGTQIGDHVWRRLRGQRGAGRVVVKGLEWAAGAAGPPSSLRGSGLLAAAYLSAGGSRFLQMEELAIRRKSSGCLQNRAASSAQSWWSACRLWR